MVKMAKRSSKMMTRRKFAIYAGSYFATGIAVATLANQAWFRWLGKPEAEIKKEIIQKVARSLISEDGHQTGISFGKSILALIDGGAIHPQKMRMLYSRRDGMPAWMDRLFKEPSSEPITFSTKTAQYLLNLLWPLGMATKTKFNLKSPLNGPKVGNYASTGGWILGKQKNGGVYFNKIETMALSDAQEQTILKVAKKIYRPCCNNSTFFQDCNHGSALLGLLELAALQGHDEKKLYELALVANSYWYPSKYVEIALYFNEIKKKNWKKVPPQELLAQKYSSNRGWKQNVHAALRKANLLPAPSQQNSCGV